MGAVDVHNHLFSPKLVEVVAEHYPELRERIDWDAGIVKNVAGTPLKMEREDDRATEMADVGVTMQAVSVRTTALVGRSSLEADTGRRLALSEAINAYLGEVVAGSPDSYRAFADAPLEASDPDAAARVILDGIDHQGLSGVTMYTNYSGTYLDDPRYVGLLQELDDRAATVFFHPTFPPDTTPYTGYRLYSIVGFPAETTLVVLRLIYSGTLDQFPRIQFIIPHLGGFLPYIWWRLGLVHRQDREVFHPKMKLDPTVYLRRLFYDTAITDAASLTLAIERVGHGQLMVGTDTPYGLEEVVRILGAIAGLDVGPDGREAILSENALRLLGRSPHRRNSSSTSA